MGLTTGRSTFSIKIRGFERAWMDVKNIMLSEISQSEKDVRSHLSVESNEQNKQTNYIETDL